MAILLNSILDFDVVWESTKLFSVSYRTFKSFHFTVLCCPILIPFCNSYIRWLIVHVNIMQHLSQLSCEPNTLEISSFKQHLRRFPPTNYSIFYPFDSENRSALLSSQLFLPYLLHHCRKCDTLNYFGICSRIHIKVKYIWVAATFFKKSHQGEHVNISYFAKCYCVSMAPGT